MGKYWWKHPYTNNPHAQLAEILSWIWIFDYLQKCGIFPAFETSVTFQNGPLQLDISICGCRYVEAPTYKPILTLEFKHYFNTETPPKWTTR
jgi:hypothetical protein